MPLYEYACKGCNHEFELLILGSEAPQCPACTGHELEKRLSVFAAQTRGAAPRMSAPGSCGSCGDARGPGAYSMN